MRARPQPDSASPTLSVGRLVDAGTAALAAVDTPRLDAELLLASATGASRSALLAHRERRVERDTEKRFLALVARRASGEPLAYLTGQREFFSLALAVSPAVLVPRPETEHVVEAVLERCNGRPRPRVLDVGTGSGAIALAVRHARPDAEVTGCDVSEAALAVARENAARLALPVRWVESHWLTALAGERFDVIASNPPYVHSADVAGALALEPRLALDGGADGLDAYRALLGAAAAHLEPDGALVLEHGAAQRGPLTALAEAAGWRMAAAHDDLAGLARVLVLEPDRAP